MMWAHGYGLGFGWMGMLFGGLMMLVFWGALIALIFFAGRALVRSGADQSRTPPPAEGKALDILKERYARGEITKEQFEEMKRDLLT
jgi:putative membrane protein